MVESTLNYLAPMKERPYYYLSEPPAGTPWRNTTGDVHTVAIHDARELADPSLDAEGFLLARLETAVDDLYDARAVKSRYYREVEARVASLTGARRVLAFDHNVRSVSRAERRENGAQKPVRLAHNDYTERSGPQRVRDLLGAEASALLAERFSVINVWKPIRGPVETTPLAICEAPSLHPEDLVPTDLVYSDRRGEIYTLAYHADHRWFYFPRMAADEAMIFKCYDSDRSVARFTAHSAFDDPTSPPGAAERESIEVRTLAFY